MSTIKNVAASKAGTNVVAEIKDGKLFLANDLSAPTSPSKTGKSDILATTAGNVAIPGTDLKLGLNIYRSKA
jgi:hypothetical protein